MSRQDEPDSTVEEEERLLLEIDSEEEDLGLEDSDIEILDTPPPSPRRARALGGEPAAAQEEPGPGSPLGRGEPVGEEGDFEFVALQPHVEDLEDLEPPQAIGSPAATPRAISPVSVRSLGDPIEDDGLITVSEAEGSDVEDDERRDWDKWVRQAKEELADSPYLPLVDHAEVLNGFFREYPEMEGAFRAVERNLIKMVRRRPCKVMGSSMCLGKVAIPAAPPAKQFSSVEIHEVPAPPAPLAPPAPPIQKTTVATQTKPQLQSFADAAVQTVADLAQAEPLQSEDTTRAAGEAVPEPEVPQQDDATRAAAHEHRQGWSGSTAEGMSSAASESNSETNATPHPCRRREQAPQSEDLHHTGWLVIDGNWVEVLPRLPGCFNCSRRHHYSRCEHPTRVFCFRCGRRNVTVRNCPHCSPAWRQEGPYIRKLRTHVPWNEALPPRDGLDELQRFTPESPSYLYPN